MKWTNTTPLNPTNLNKIVLDMNPVGTILFNTTGVNPTEYIGGTWVAWGSGRVPVGVDTGQTEFNTVEKTGGEKTHQLSIAEMPSHNHSMIGIPKEYEWTAQTAGMNYSFTDQETYQQVTSNTGGNQPHNNLQPYITCYMWKRTA